MKTAISYRHKVKSELVNSGTPCSLYVGWLYCQHHEHYMLHSNLIWHHDQRDQSVQSSIQTSINTNFVLPQNRFSSPEGGVDGPPAGGSTFVSGGSTPRVRGGWINPWFCRHLFSCQQTKHSHFDVQKKAIFSVKSPSSRISLTDEKNSLWKLWFYCRCSVNIFCCLSSVLHCTMFSCWQTKFIYLFVQK